MNKTKFKVGDVFYDKQTESTLIITEVSSEQYIVVSSREPCRKQIWFKVNLEEDRHLEKIA